jgi:hypothetical protein
MEASHVSGLRAATLAGLGVTIFAGDLIPDRPCRDPERPRPARSRHRRVRSVRRGQNLKRTCCRTRGSNPCKRHSGVADRYVFYLLFAVFNTSLRFRLLRLRSGRDRHCRVIVGTRIRQLTAANVSLGSNSEELSLSKCFPGYTQKADIARYGLQVAKVPISDIGRLWIGRFGIVSGRGGA